MKHLTRLFVLLAGLAVGAASSCLCPSYAAPHPTASVRR